LFDENNELMTIVNGNAKIYIYYHYYYFSNVKTSILKWYNITIQMEIIFCRCGGFGSYFWWFRTLHSAPFFQHQSIPYRNCGSEPVRGAEARKALRKCPSLAKASPLSHGIKK